LGFVLALFIVFMLFLSYQGMTFFAKREQVHHVIKMSELLRSDSDGLKEYLILHGIEKLEEEAALKAIEKAEVFILDPLIRTIVNRVGIELYLSNNHTLFILRTKDEVHYFKTTKTLFSTRIFPLGIYVVLLFLLLYGIYYYTKSSLSPLVRLNDNIDSFSKGEEVEVSYERGHDEIANVANAFYSAVEHNKKLKAQRDMYIRTIMHEIKTPLTKAKFITHFMPQEQEEKAKLEALFDSMQEELDKLHEFESISTKLCEIKMLSYSLNTLVADVCDVLLLEDKEIDIDEIEVIKSFDYTLFMVAIKNLIDNAFKYSRDKHVNILIRKEYIEIKNLAVGSRALEISRLIEPFEQEDESSSGMGLGLYLINEIINKHHLKLAYEFVDDYHRFRIIF